MALLEWYPGMSVGVDLIDEEHKRIISALNALYDAIGNSSGAEILSQTLADVVSYTSYHFAHEERIFLDSKYPDSAAHMEKHKKMIGRLMEIHENARRGVTEELSVDLMIFLKEWLIEHIQGTDMQYVPYLKTPPT